MQQENILPILYDMAIVIGSEDRSDLLLKKTLMRIMYHTSYPCGFILKNDGSSDGMTLAASIGDHRLNESLDEIVKISPVFLKNSHGKVNEKDLELLPVKKGFYKSFQSLEIQNYGRMILLSPEQNSHDSYSEIFAPVLMNFSRAIKLCLQNESYQKALIEDRNEARSRALRFRMALDNSPDLIVLFDPVSLKMLDYNKAMIEMLNCRGEDMERKSINKIPLFAYPEIWESEIVKLLSAGEARVFETSLAKYDSTKFPAEVRLSLFSLPEQENSLVMAVCRDITERKNTQEILFQEKEKAQVTLHSIGDGVITTDSDGIVEYLNPIAEELTGWSLGHACGKSLNDIFHIVNEITGEPVENPVTRCIRDGLIVGLENHTKLISRKGIEYAIEDSAAPIRNREGQIIGAVLVFHDVSSSRELANKLSWQATHDALTGLLNRRELEYRLGLAVESAKNQNLVHTLLFMDLDQFKIVNDTCGHLAGDELLRQISNMLMMHMRETDSFARLGGDEFGVLLNRCNVEHATRVANELREAISAYRLSWEGKSFEVGVSIGLVPITEHTVGLAELLADADAACYTAKDLGRNRLHVYHPEDKELTRRRGEIQWITRIRDAFEKNNFCIYSQEIISTEPSSKEKMAELLVRMKDNNGNIILPGAFLPSAERYNLMEKLDKWIIERSLQHFANKGFPPDISMFNINISAMSVSSNEFLEFVRECLKKYPVPCEKICFEITETSAISNLYTVSNFIGDFRSRGCKVALDDFGTGLSSFGYLKNLFVDFIKIDGIFIKDIVQDPVDSTLVQYINQLGHVLGLSTIAEYVEDEKIFNKLRTFGVDYAQGFWIHKPSPFID